MRVTVPGIGATRLHSVDAEEQTFHVVVDAGDVASVLFARSMDGQAVDLVVVEASSGTWSLRGVIVVSAEVAGETMSLALDAERVDAG